MLCDVTTWLPWRPGLVPGQPLPGSAWWPAHYITHHTSHITPRHVMSRDVTWCHAAQHRKRWFSEEMLPTVTYSGVVAGWSWMGPISSWLLGEESWPGLGWAGVCVSSHEGDDVCVYVAIVAMSLQCLHEPQCSNVSLAQVSLSWAVCWVCGSLHSLLMVLS